MNETNDVSPMTHKEVSESIMDAIIQMRDLKTWVESHTELIDHICSTCRTYFAPQGVVCYPFAPGDEIKELLRKLNLSDDEITTTIDGVEITVHHI